MRRCSSRIFAIGLISALLAWTPGLCGGQAPGPAPRPAPAVQPPAPAPKTVTFRLANGKDVIGEVVSEDAKAVVIFNGAGNIALRVADIIKRTPGGTLEADTGSKVGLVSKLTARDTAAPLRAVAPPGAEPIAAAIPAQGQGTLAAMVAEPEKYLATLKATVNKAGVGPTLIEIESHYQVRPVNRAEAYAVLNVLEKKAQEWLAPIAKMDEKELRAELTNSPFSNEETFDGAKISRLTQPDMRQLVALKRLVHAINKDTYYTYAVNTSFTDLLNPRRPMGDCNASCALVYHLAARFGYDRGLQLFEDKAGHHAVLAVTCINDSRHYFAETTGGFLSGNPKYQQMAENPETLEMTVISSLMNEGFPPGLSAVDNLRLALILRVTSGDRVSRNNFKHYFVKYLNTLIDAHDETALTQWAAVYDAVEGAGSYAALPRTVVMQPAR